MDYFTLLVQKIWEVESDPAKLRELVYANARLALKRHVNVHYPAVSVQDGKRLIGDLDLAIERLEGDLTAPVARPSVAEVDEAAASILVPSSNEKPAAAAVQEFNFVAAYEGRSDDNVTPADRTLDEAPRASPTSDQGVLSGRSDVVPPADHNPNEIPPAQAQPGSDPPAISGRSDADRAPDRILDENPHYQAQRAKILDVLRTPIDIGPSADLNLGKGDAVGALSPVNPSVFPGERDEILTSWTEGSDDRRPNAEDLDDARPAAAARPNNRFAARGATPRPTSSPRARLRSSMTGRHEEGDAVGPYPTQDRGTSRDWPYDEAHESRDSRELILVPDHGVPANRGSTYMVRGDGLPQRRDERYRDPPVPPRAAGRTILIGLGIASQFAVVLLAGAAFYVSMAGRNAQGPGVQELAAAIPHLPARALPAVTPGAIPDGAAETLPAGNPSLSTSRAAAALAAPTFAAAPAAAAPGFPRPTAYGVYAISDSRLIELEQVPTAPVDPRLRTTLQIVKPSRTVISDSKLSFVAFRRDLISTAPDKVSVRIAARIARSMTFDSSGKAVTAPPPVDTWLIRDQGYDLRVSPVRDNPEMVVMRPEGDDFSFPAGRYELVLGPQSYDFVIAGTVADPAQCVEGVATARGPAFYECRTQ